MKRLSCVVIRVPGLGAPERYGPHSSNRDASPALVRLGWARTQPQSAPAILGNHSAAEKAIKILFVKGELQRQVIGKKHIFELAHGGEE